MSGVEVFFRSDTTGKPVPVSALNPLPVTGGTGGGGSTDMTATNVLLGAVTETAPATDTASSGLNGRLQRVAQRLTSLIAQFPAALGSQAAAASLGVAWSTEDVARIGIITETAPGTDTASSGLNGRLQRIAQRLTSLIASQPASLGEKAAAASFPVTLSTENAALIGALLETAPASDTASSGLNGRLQRIAQRLTSLIALVPASLGSKAAASSFAVTDSTEDIARMGIITETAPANDTASSGLNGRLQRIAQNITAQTALLPASIGQKARAASFAIALAAEDSAQLGGLTETAPASDTASSGLNGRLQRIAQRLTSLIAGGVVFGLTASGSSLTAAPITTGGLAKTANPTAVADGQVVNQLMDKLGKVIAVTTLRELKGVQQTSITVSTETTIVTAAGSGVFADLYGLVLANRSATGVYVTIKDATAGTTRSIFYVPANDTRGFTLDAGSAVPQAAANNNWTATVSSAVTAIEVTAMYVKNL
jgi:hypothetical protein